MSAQDVAATKRLPSLPGVAQRMLEIAQQDEPSYRELSEAIRADAVISGRVLKTVNSALFALRPKVESIEDAIPRLGISTLRTLMLSFHLSSWKASSPDTQNAFRSIWRSCLTQAVIAELLAEKAELESSVCFTGGLIQDIGILAMVTELGEDYISNVLYSSSHFHIADREKEQFGFTHVDVTGEILKRWNMGHAFIDATRQHHELDGKVESSEATRFAAVLQSASLGASILATRASSSAVEEAVTQWLRSLNSNFGLNPLDAREVISEIEERVTEYSVVFNFDISNGDTVEQVVGLAKELLQEIALESQLAMISVQQSANSKAKADDEIIYRDFLCGLYNRRFLDEVMGTHLDAWVSKRKPVAMLYVDVDDFKLINDAFGHRTGDLAIKHVAKWLTDCTRDTDFVFRIGGDEFLVIMQIKEKYYETVSRRLAADLPDLDCPDAGAIPMSLSVGGVIYQPKHGDEFDMQSLIDQADRQMYHSKKSGGNRASLV
ncbi:GGDEF domain-containing protein [Mariniblastus fucicola]|nr:GGDEF domain-containing protein [Mariniblastus fucicola]